jgi:hypothetical protein
VAEIEDVDDERAPICPYCGATALPAEANGEFFVCENPECDAFGDPVSS